MGLIKTAMMSGAAMYGVNKLAKTYEVRQTNRPIQQNGSAQRQSRDYSTSPSRGANGGQYDDNYQGPPQFSSYQQQRNLDQSSQPQEYWYLNNNNEWTRLPQEYVNVQVRNGSPQFPPQMPARQQQLEFDYPQQQGYVEEIPQQSSRGHSSMPSSDMIQQGLGFMMNAANGKGGKKGKDDKMSDVMSMFSR